MTKPSEPASNAILYTTYGLFLVLGTSLAWQFRSQIKQEFLSGNRTQTAMPLAFNFVASALGSGILFSFPQMATIAGVQGVLVYSLSCGLAFLPLVGFGTLIRTKCPDGFVLTQWTGERYGLLAKLYLSLMTLLTLFLYMIAELSALYQVVPALTGMSGLAAVIVQCVVTTIYTSIGGFKISFLTDVVQGMMVVLLVLIATITIAVKADIQPSLIEPSGLTHASLIGWQLIYILPVCLITNTFFLSNYWLRVFSSKTDRDLWIGAGTAAVVLTVLLTLIGCTGLIAAWTGAWPGEPAQDGSVAFFLLLERLPAWSVGVVLVMVVTLSTAAFDSLQSAMVSSASNDLFQNRLTIWWIRGAVVLLIFPVVVLAIKAPSILRIYLISDLVSSTVVPSLVLGLFSRFRFVQGVDIVAGGLGGIVTVFVFGTIYYGNAREGARLLLIEQGLSSGDWGVFGAFVAAPVGSLLWTTVSVVIRWFVFRFRLGRVPPTRRFEDDLVGKTFLRGADYETAVDSSS